MSTNMPEIIEKKTDIEIEEVNGKPCVSSRAVAERFKKEHKVVLEAFDKLHCSQEFSRQNFLPASYLDKQGKSRRMLHMTRDGFSFLAMGFTGPEAAAWKEWFIAKFNEYEEDRRSGLAVQSDANAVIAKAFGKVLNMLEAHERNLGNKIFETRDELKTDITEVKAEVIGVKDRLTIVEEQLEPRNEISKPDKTKHRNVIDRAFHGYCPCCFQKKIIDQHTKMKVNDFHFEHYYSRARCKFEETWIVCVDCHQRIHNEKGLVREGDAIRSAFINYHDKAKRLVYFNHESGLKMPKPKQLKIDLGGQSNVVSLPVYQDAVAPVPVIEAAKNIVEIVMKLYHDGVPREDIAAAINRTPARVTQIVRSNGGSFRNEKKEAARVAAS